MNPGDEHDPSEADRAFDVEEYDDDIAELDDDELEEVLDETLSW